MPDMEKMMAQAMEKAREEGDKAWGRVVNENGMDFELFK